jgi:hypothetical protein
MNHRIRFCFVGRPVILPEEEGCGVGWDGGHFCACGLLRVSEVEEFRIACGTAPFH